MSENSVSVTITASAKGLEDAMKGASKSVKDNIEQIKTTLDDAKSGLDNFGASMRSAFEMAGVFVAVEAFHKVADAIREVGDRAITIRAMSDLIGVSVTNYQALGIAAEETGVAQEKMDRAAEKLGQTLAAAKSGATGARDALFDLGVSLEQIQSPGFDVTALLQVLAARMQDSSTKASTLAALVQLLGLRGAKAAEAIAAFGATQEENNRKVADAHGLSDQQDRDLEQLGIAYHRNKTELANLTGQLLLYTNAMIAAHDGEKDLTIGNMSSMVGKLDADPEADARKKAEAAAIESAMAEKRAQLQAIADALAFFKEGTTQKLALLKEYLMVATQTYGADSQAAKVAGKQVLAEEFAVAEAKAAAAKEAATKLLQFDKEIMRAQLANNRTRMENVRQMMAESTRLLADQLKIEEDAVAAKRELQLEGVADAEAVIAMLRADGQISASQEILAKRNLEETKYQIELKALQDRLALLDLDSLAHQQAMEKLELLAAKHSAKMSQLDLQGAIAHKSIVATMMDGADARMQQSVASWLNGAASFKSAWQGVATAVAESMANMAAKNIATMIEEAAVGKAIRIKAIMGDAYKAASGAYAATAGIPYVGPFLAPAAAAAAYTATAVFATASAKAGYDVPAGVNPLTQLHAREMVLPAQHADVIRAMSRASRDSRKDGDTLIVQFPGQRMGNQYLMNIDDLTEALKKIHRNGCFSVAL